MPQAQRTLLEIINTAQRELSLPVSATIINNTTDLTAQQMLSYAQAEIEALGRKDHNWTVLTFENNIVVSPPVQTTGDVTENSPVITNIPSTAALLANFFTVAGSLIPVGARILSVDSATQVTMTMNATGTTIGATLKFSRDTYPEPDDFDHFINRTWWDRTNRWQLLGPMSPQTDQWHQSGIVAFGPRRFFRQIGPYTSNYRLWPPPAELVNPLQLVFEYISNRRVRVQGSTTNFAFLFANDTDIPLLNDRLIIAGIKWRFWEQKGFNWLSKRKEYDDMVDQFIARDGGAPTLGLAKEERDFLISSYNVQDGFFPGPIGPNMS